MIEIRQRLSRSWGPPKDSVLEDPNQESKN